MALCACLCDGVGYRYILLTKICMTTIHYNATMKMTKNTKRVLLFALLRLVTWKFTIRLCWAVAMVLNVFN